MIPADTVTRDFTVATFVVWQAQVLLLFHRKLHLWLPPGGHIEPNELPDNAARREVLEETGLCVELMGGRGLSSHTSNQLIRPEGIQIEHIGPGHEHIDLIYFARPLKEPHATMLDNHEVQQIGWYSVERVALLHTPVDVVHWVERALSEARDWPNPEPT